jgi:predicted unusual protein kinase regulating ubiquinone biosynthesis (AarF/ABC1/UbiB family)
LLLFAIVLCSYGVQWLLARVLGARVARRWNRVHLTNARRLARGFARLRGVYIKLGQVMSVLGTFLPKAYGEVLEQLQDSVPPRPFSEIDRRLVEAFGESSTERFASFEREPIAAASLAQVHRATTLDGRAVAVKVLYPGIEQIIARDLAVLRLVLPVARLFILVSRFERVLEQLTAMLRRETDYQNERRNIERMRTIFAGKSEVIIPEVIGELSAASVLTMSYESGVKIGDLNGMRAEGIDPQAIATLLVECYFTMLLDERVFHADPHPGNFLVRPGPKLVMLDFGAVENVTPPLADGMKTVVLGGLTRNPELVLKGIEQMGFVATSGDRELLRHVGHEYLKALAEVRITDFSSIDPTHVEKLSGFQQLRGRMRDVMRSVEYPEGYFYVERTLALLFGLVGKLAPEQGLPGVAAPLASKALLKGFARQSTTASSGEPGAA